MNYWSEWSKLFFFNKFSWFESIVLSVQETKCNTDFQDGRHDGYHGFSIGTILTIFIYKSPKYYGSHLGFPIERILAFLTCKFPQYFLPSFESISLLVQEKKRKTDF